MNECRYFMPPLQARAPLSPSLPDADLSPGLPFLVAEGPTVAGRPRCPVHLEHPPWPWDAAATNVRPPRPVHGRPVDAPWAGAGSPWEHRRSKFSGTQRSAIASELLSLLKFLDLTLGPSCLFATTAVPVWPFGRLSRLGRRSRQRFTLTVRFLLPLLAMISYSTAGAHQAIGEFRLCRNSELVLKILWSVISRH
jgi:hypothetical protein